jgi:CheY-like chemotaxis protein
VPHFLQFVAAAAKEGEVKKMQSLHSEVANGAGRRVLVVEDEPMIRLLLDDMLSDLGYTMAAEAGRLDEALSVASRGQFDVAILDVNLNGQPITPVVDILVSRGVPFVFVSGYARRGIPEGLGRIPLLQKPFQVEGLARALAAVAAKPSD